MENKKKIIEKEFILLFSIFILLTPLISANTFGYNYLEKDNGGGENNIYIISNDTELFHNNMSGLQGGNDNERYHMNLGWYNKLQLDLFNFMTNSELSNALTNYFTKSQSDSRYLQSETDPIFTAQNASIWNEINSKLPTEDQRYNNTAQINAVNSSLSSKIDLLDGGVTNLNSSVLNINNSLSSQIAIVDGKINVSFNQSLTDLLYYPLSNPYNFINESEVYNDSWINQTFYNTTQILSLLSNYYNQSEINILVTELNLSFNNYYNKSQIDIMLENIEVDLSNYYNKTEIEGFGYYNISSFDINDYALNSSLANYYPISNPYNFINETTSYDDAWINDTIDNKITENNNTITDWINYVFVKISDIVSLVGNWSLDKPNYYNTTQIDNRYSNNTGDQDLSPYALINNLVALVGNWTADKINYYLKSEVYNKTEVDGLLSSAGNSSFNQSLTDSLYFKTGQNINAPTINLTINNFNMTGEFRYDTNNVFGYTLPTRTLDVHRTEMGDGTIPTGSTAQIAHYTVATDSTVSTINRDAFLTIAGQTTGLTTTNNLPAKNLRKFTLVVSAPTDTFGHKEVVGCYSSSTSEDINTVDTGVFFYSQDNSQWNAKCCEAGSCTNIDINYSISSNEYVWLDIISNAPNTINGQATMFSFYLNNVYKGNCTTNLPTFYNRCGSWLENSDTYLDTILYDFAYIESTRKS